MANAVIDGCTKGNTATGQMFSDDGTYSIIVRQDGDCGWKTTTNGGP